MEYLIIFLPLLGAMASGLFGKYIGDRFWEFLTSSFVSISAILSLIIFYEVVIKIMQKPYDSYYNFQNGIKKW